MEVTDYRIENPTVPEMIRELLPIQQAYDEENWPHKQEGRLANLTHIHRHLAILQTKLVTTPTLQTFQPDILELEVAPDAISYALRVVDEFAWDADEIQTIAPFFGRLEGIKDAVAVAAGPLARYGEREDHRLLLSDPGSLAEHPSELLRTKTVPLLFAAADILAFENKFALIPSYHARIAALYEHQRLQI